jgi:selenocysteine lyase/cysteine desulfurase
VVAMTRAIAVRTFPSARELRRRFVPALPTLWPEMLSPLAADRAPAFPFGHPRMTRFYFARNAVFHGVRLLGVAGREVLVPAYHHGVEVAALAAAGAIPRFVRVDGRMRLDLEDLAAKVTSRTGAIYVIHYAGFAQPMDDVRRVARARGLPVIEDCALALLSGDGARPLGSTGDLGIFCFYKTLPVPNGGALVVNAAWVRGAPPRPEPAPLGSTLQHAAGSVLSNAAFRLGETGEALRSGVRGVFRAVRAMARIRPVSTGTRSFDPGAVGLGMSGLSDAIARRLDAGVIVTARRRNYFHLLGRLRDRVPPVFAELPAGVSPLFYPLLCDDKLAVKRRLAARGIETIDFWREGHPLCPVDEFPEFRSLRRRVLELPVHQDLEPEDADYVARCAREALE